MRNVLFFTLILSSVVCNAQNKNQTTKSVKKETSSASHWQYSKETDKMTDSVVAYKAILYGNGQVGPSSKLPTGTPYIGLQYADSATIFAYGVIGWKFSQYYSDSVKVRMRFDEEKPEYYYFSTETHKNNPGEIYLRAAYVNKFMKKLKKSKRFRLEADFNNQGNYVFEFNVGDLKWNHQDKNR